MGQKHLQLLLVAICLSSCISAYSQVNIEKAESGNSVIDSLENKGIILNREDRKPQISLSKDQAIKFLHDKTQARYWIDLHNPLRSALSQLVYEAAHPRFDSAEYFLRRYQFDSLRIPWDKFYTWEPLRLKIPVKSTPEQFLISDTSLVSARSDSVRKKQSGIVNQSLEKLITALKDTTVMVVIDTLNEVSSQASGFPFKYFNYPFQADSLNVAVQSLLKYVEDRDSSVINFTGSGQNLVPVWMNSRKDVMIRYWLKNEFNDSVTVWIGNPAKNTVGLYLEHGVNFRRPDRQSNYSKARINVPSIDNSKLHKVQKIIVKPNYWRYRAESSFIFSQTALSNWVKGGENSVSTATDITGFADYSNKDLKLSSNNFARLNLGFLKTGSEAVRKNLDLLETNSKLNHKAFGKFDFSAILLFKTQIAPGNNFLKCVNGKDSSIMVSKFLNPAIVTVGIGLDYKPNKTTSINFSPLSYKGTFVFDAAYNTPFKPGVNIDQTLYGVAKDKRSLNEAGVSFMISNEYRPVKSVVVTNRLQLFTNYIKNPQNVDIDWEMIAVANLNWFTDMRFNTHLIFDDDTKTLNPKEDSTTHKTARAQFKEMLGLSFVFRF